MKIKKTLILFICICLVMVPIVSIADFGDFSGGSDYGGGWDSDWSSSSWDSGSSWSSWDNDWSSSSSYGYGSSGGTYYSGAPVVITNTGSVGSSVFSSLFFIIFVIMVIIIIRKMMKQNQSATTIQGESLTDKNTLTDMRYYTNLDPSFDQSAFEERWSNVYIQMQQCWQNKDISPLRPYFTDAYYAQAESQLRALTNSGKTNYVEHPTVLGVTSRGFYQRDGMDHIVILIRSRIIDYVVDDKTSEVVSGRKDKELFMVYEADVARETGMKTSETTGTHTINCPNCGAPLNINSTARCPYCDSIVTVDKHDWAITKIKGISQTTAS